MKRAACLGLGLALASTVALAQSRSLSYGPEENVYGSCRPALTLTNTTGQPIDYAQIDMRYRLRDGRTVLGEQKSRYRDGVANPIAPGASRALVIHHDESTPFGAPCSDLVGATIVGVTCHAASGGDCSAALGLKPDSELPLNR